MPFNPSEPYWEPLTVIGYVAGRTSRLRLDQRVDSPLSQSGPRSLFTGTPAQIGETLHRYQEIGIQNFRCDFPSPSIDGLLQAMERFATEVRPRVV
jgi:hypothetical protein